MSTQNKDFNFKDLLLYRWHGYEITDHDKQKPKKGKIVKTEKNGLIDQYMYYWEIPLHAVSNTGNQKS